MIAPDLLQILCCPETQQKLELVEGPPVEQINRAIAAGQVRNRAGAPVTEPIDAGLRREDRKWLYPIRQRVPVLLIDEALPLDPNE